MSELSYEASDEASENELLERSLSVWRGWSSMREDFTPIPLDIHTASSIGQYDCVRTLISRGEVVIDRKNVGGWTPLMYACYIGHDHIASLLIDAGCNVNMKNQRGQVPLMLAASCGNETVGRTLLRKGAELEAADRNGWTALFHATYSGHQNFVSFLLDQQANMDAAEPSTGMTPFMKAAIEGHEIIVQLFLQHGVNVNAKAYNGDTARTLALTSGYMKIVSLIDNHVMPHSTLRSEPGLGDYLSSSDEVEKRQRPQHQRGSRAKSKGPSIRDGPEAIARMIDRSRTADHMRYPHLVVPRGYMSFPHGEGERAETLLSYRDVTSPINQEDYHLDSSGGKDSCDYDDSNAFSKTGAITIKSSSSSSGGLIGLVGLSRQNSADSDDFLLHDSGVHNSSQSEDNADGEASSCEPAGGEEKERAGRHGASKDQGAPQSTSGKEAAVRGSERGHQEEGGGGDPSDSKSFAAQQSREEGSCDGAAAGGGSAPSEGCRGEALTSGKEAGVIPAVGVLNPPPGEDSRPHPFPLQFGDVVFPEVMGPGAGGERAGSPVAAAAFSQTTARAEHYSETLLLDRNHGFDPSPGVENSETVRDLPAGSLSGCAQFATAGPPLPSSHMQRRSSCQARLSRLSVVDRDGGGGSSATQGKEVRHRRRSANSPPTFHREYGGRGQDLGSGTGRVSCLSDIPTSPGPQAGYPVTSSTRNSSQLPAIKGGGGDSGGGGGGGGDRFQGNSQVPVAAVAPTCLPPGFTSLTPHPTSAFVAPQNPQLHKYPTPEASSDSSAQDSNPTGPVPTGGHQLDGSTAAGREPAGGPGGSGEPEGGVPGHRDLAALLEQLGLSKYAALFVEQDVDLQVFLSLTDNDLKEIGIKLFGPRKKMTNAIARWHSQAPAARSCLEQAYADRLEGEMQEMAIQLNQAYDSVEKLRAQVLQERQLRSVTESCLMEERGAWQRVHHSLLDTHQHCTDIADAVSKLSSLQAELKQRLGQPQNNNNHLPSAVPPSSSDLVALTTEQLILLCDQYLYDLRQHSAALARSMDCIISNPPATGAIHEARDIDQDFA